MRPAGDGDAKSARAALRALPKVDRLLAAAELQPLIAAHSRPEVLREIRTVLDGLRRDAGGLSPADLGVEAIARQGAAALARRARPYYRRVVNGTGVILHTGIGRAVLASPVAAA